LARYDLILKGGRVVDPSQQLDQVADVAFAGGRVAAVGADLVQRGADQVLEVAGRIVTPGLIDLHSHVYHGGTALGVDAERVARRSGTTTFLDVGSAGPGNFAGFKAHVIDRAAVRIKALLNISFAGIFAFGPKMMVGECLNLDLLEPKEAVRVARAYPDDILGIKVRVGRVTSGGHGLGPVHLALEAADLLQLPLMAHIDEPPPSLDELLGVLRPGDILTHCCRPFPNAPVRADGRVREALLAARERGIVFDIGHGSGSFEFESARQLLDLGFKPDVISSDVHVLNVDAGPAYDLLMTMSKFLALGLDLDDVVQRATVNPANAMRLAELGTLAPGAPGDASVLELAEGSFVYQDVVGERLESDRRLLAKAVIIAGRVWHAAD
jgi:dihydroorotase